MNNSWPLCMCKILCWGYNYIQRFFQNSVSLHNGRWEEHTTLKSCDSQNEYHKEIEKLTLT